MNKTTSIRRSYRPVRSITAWLARLFALAIAVGTSPAVASPPAELAAAAEFSSRPILFSRLEDFDGGAGAPSASLPHWRQMLHEIRRDAPDAGEWPAPRDIRDRARETEGGPIPIAVLDATVTVPRPDGSRAPLPVFAFAAIRDHGHRGALTTFELDASLWLGESPARYPTIELDFADGRGWQTVRPGERPAARWTTVGPKSIRLRATLPDRTSRLAAFRFEVRSLVAPAPHDTLRITGTVPYLGSVASADAYVYLADGHATVTNPILVIEGFDLEDTYNWEELYELLNQQALLETLRSRGYDLVVLDFDDATDYLQRNAYVVVEALEQINVMMPGPGDVALVGASMGGLLGRYALAWMETQALDANVRMFLSFDSPQAGANIPLGMQYWLDFFSDLSTDADFLLSRLDRPGARQMLLYHYTVPPGASGEADPLRADFLADLAAAGNWPTAPRLVSVANGSGARSNQGFAPGAQVVEYEYSSFLVDIVGNVFAVPDGGPTTVFDGLIDIILLPQETMTVTIDGAIPWDGAPGGFRGSMAQMDATPAPYGDIIALHDNHCFVPTISALALDVTDPFHDIAGDVDLLTRTPFDTVYYPADNQLHMAIDATSLPWFLTEIEAGVTSVEPTIVVSGPLELLPGGPNPFRSNTTVRFRLHESRRVTADVFDVSGRRVDRLLAEAPLLAGAHELRWPIPGRAIPPAAGVYWVRLRAGSEVASRRIVRID